MRCPLRAELNRLASAQDGLFSTAQALHLGYTNNQLSRGVSQGAFRWVRRSVYAIGGLPASEREPIVAAVLAGGPTTVASHASAAEIHQLWCARLLAPEVEVISLGRLSPARLSGIVVHRPYGLTERDIHVRNGLPVTSPARTLLDVAARLSDLKLEKALDEGLLARHWSLQDLTGAVGRTARNFPGRGRLLALVEDRLPDGQPESHLELRVLRALRPLQPFQVHYVVSVENSTYVLDVAWPDLRVAVEIDGRAHRLGSRSAFDRDRHKGNALALAGWQVVHVTSTMPAAAIRHVVQQFLGLAARTRTPPVPGRCG